MSKEKLSAQILAYFKENPTAKYTVQEIVDHLQMNAAGQFKFVVQALVQLEHDKEISLNEDNQFSLLQKQTLPRFEGVFHANDRGYGFVTVDPESPDFFVNPTQTNGALNGDEVEVEMTNPGDPTQGKSPEGRITKILAHSLTQVVGEFQPVDHAGNFPNIIGSVKLKDKKLAAYRFLVEDHGLHPVAGEVILAEITAYPDANLPGILKGVATKVIGNVNDPGMDILQIVYKHDIPTEFPQEVLDEIATIPDYVTDEDKKGRVDLTDQAVVTIDSIESKDLDDAVNVWKLPNGNFHLGVHIADVSHYVKPGSPLDQEAFERGTSVYLTDRVIPMLPAKLSNGICSLNPKVERCAMTCEMEINEQGEVVAHKIFPSVIKSTERMTYVAMNQILEAHDPKTRAQYEALVPMFEEMAQLHKILLKMRKRRGAIEFEDTEAKIIVDEQGHPIDIQLRERGLSERMIESFMLAANETVAAHYNELHLPFVYRIHETPKPEKIEAFFETLACFGIEVAGKKSEITAKMLQSVLKKVAGKPEEAMISTLMLRSMQQAKYSPQPLGHFGLAAQDYTHFTSPIRRYPDLMVHRLIRLYANPQTLAEAKEKYQAKLEEITTHSSQMERRAIDAERDTDAMKKAEFMADHVGEEFDAVVSSVTKFGMFVSLPNTVEGLIHISEIKGDYFEFVEKHLALVGRKTKRTYRIGQPIRVKLTNVNVEQKEIDFALLNPQNAPTSNLLDGVKLPELKRNKKRHERFKNNKKTSKNGKKPFYKQKNERSKRRK